MCSLCGMLGGEAHWTDRSVPAGLAGQTEAAARLRARQARTRLINTVLQHYGLKLTDWSGNGYVLSSRTGRTAMINNLSELWASAEQITGRRCDPLDEALLASLESAIR
jgi:type II secretory pathway pseudopilin PulG